MRRILCLYLPNWPIQRALAGRERRVGQKRAASAGPPTAKMIDGGPSAADAALSHPTFPEKHSFVLRTSYLVLILHARDPRRGDVVVAASRPAYDAGVRLGMPLAEASALVEHGSHKQVGWAVPTYFYPAAQRTVVGGAPPTIQPHDPAADLAELSRLAEYCERFSPLVGWEAPSPDCLFLDITGIGMLFGGEENLAREVIKDLACFGYEARVAVADTIGAAWAGAKYEVQSTKYEHDTTSPLRPSSFVLRPCSHPSCFVLPLEALRLPSETLDLLSQLGIGQLGQVLALPRESLRARFGELLLLRIDQLLGTAEETIVAHRPPLQFAEEWLLEFPAERREVVEQILQELVRRIAQALANRREGVVRLTGRLDCAPGRPVQFEVGLFRPSADAEHLWDLVRMQLEQTTLPGAVGRVRLEAALTASLENRQGLLFAGDEHQAARQLAQLIDRCSSRLGAKAVLHPELTADPLPEKAVRYRTGVRKFKVQSSRFKVDEKRTLNFELGTLNLLRPLALYSPPLPLAAVSIAPDGPPVSFELDGRRQQIIQRWGPERIETGWWRGKSIRRDYWRVETHTGQRYWLFRQLPASGWHLHGAYA